MVDFRHVPAREILRRLEVAFSDPGLVGLKVAGMPRGEVARAIRDLIGTLEADGAPEEWTPFEVATVQDRSTDDAYVALLAEREMMGPDELRAMLKRLAGLPHYRNNLYQVVIDRQVAAVDDGDGHQPDLIHLSVKRTDQTPIRDWRHLQRIKDELLGPTFEAVELFPADERLVDSSNQYHLWALDDPTYRFPFGYGERFVIDSAEADGSGAVQRART